MASNFTLQNISSIFRGLSKKSRYARYSFEFIKRPRNLDSLYNKSKGIIIKSTFYSKSLNNKFLTPIKTRTRTSKMELNSFEPINIFDSSFEPIDIFDKWRGQYL